jgi:hypothetical protein
MKSRDSKSRKHSRKGLDVLSRNCILLGHSYDPVVIFVNPPALFPFCNILLLADTQILPVFEECTYLFSPKC